MPRQDVGHQGVGVAVKLHQLQPQQNVAAHNEIFQNVSNEEKDYFSEKSKNEVNQLNNTLNQISSVIDGTRKSYSNNQIGSGKKNNLLFNTCKVISEHAGFKIEEPKHIDSFQKNVSNQLTAISKSSNVRIRKSF